MRILAIDPGTTESGYVILDGGTIEDKGILQNEIIRDLIKTAHHDLLTIEMIASYGKPVGKETFITCLWIGRFMECTKSKTKLIERKDIKLFLCRSNAVKDPHVRQALIDFYGGDSVALAGKKCKCKNGQTKTVVPKPCPKCNASGWLIKPGPLYYVTSHEWSALALGVTAAHI
jgi:hypothetical protein